MVDGQIRMEERSLPRRLPLVGSSGMGLGNPSGSEVLAAPDWQRAWEE